MKKIVYAGLTCVGAASAASAGGIDRSGQPLDILFRDGNFVEFGYAYTNPDVGGDDISGSVVGPGGPIPTDARYNDVAKSFASYSGGLKYQVTDKVSVAFTAGEDFGSDVRYASIPGSNIGGTKAISDTYTLSLIGRYKFNTNWSVHGGVRAQWASGDIRLDGNAYGGATFQDGAGNILDGDTVAAATGGLLRGNTVSGYEVQFEQDLAFGFLVGGAYEIPDYAARISVTYFSPITHDFETRESYDTR
ncbi:MAG: outer membrane protein transport protein, partial [Pseudomonadota bacterium]